MKIIKITFLIIILIAGFLLYWFFTSKDEPTDRFNRRYKDMMNYNENNKIDKQQVQKITPVDAFKYFSGNTNPYFKHPAIYAADNKLIIVGYEYYKTFPMDQFQKAISAYKELLVLEGILEKEQ